jgi:hypothetical protein
MKVAHSTSILQKASPLRAASISKYNVNAMLSRSRGLVIVRAESGGLGNFFKKDDNKQVG